MYTMKCIAWWPTGGGATLPKPTLLQQLIFTPSASVRSAAQRRVSQSRRCRSSCVEAAPTAAGGGKVPPARQQLLEELCSAQPDMQCINAAVDTLVEAEVPFNESQLGPGPYHAVFTRGPLAWALLTGTAKQGSRIIKPTDNQAWQAFDPASKEVVNFGEVLGSNVGVTASGSYHAVDEQAWCPKLVRASVERGALSAWGLQIPLPIRGKGLVEVAYLDPELRIFRTTNGSISVQVRQERLPRLLGWPCYG